MGPGERPSLHLLTSIFLSLPRAELTRALPAPSGRPPGKEGRGRVLRQILGRGRKGEQQDAPEDPGELTSGVDDIIATFDSIAETGCQEQTPRAGSNQRSSGGSKSLPPEQRPPARQGLPPLRAQGLPPIMPGSHLRTVSQGAASHAGLGPGAPHAAPRSQQSCSKQDSLSHRPSGQALPDPWRGDSGQGLPRAWPGPPTEKLLDRLLPGRSWHQEVPGPPHLPQLHPPSAGRLAPSSWSCLWFWRGTRWAACRAGPEHRGPPGTFLPEALDSRSRLWDILLFTFLPPLLPPQTKSKRKHVSPLPSSHVVTGL